MSRNIFYKYVLKSNIMLFKDREEQLPFKTEVRSKKNRTDNHGYSGNNLQNSQKIKQQEIKNQEMQSNLDSLKKTLNTVTKNYANPLQQSIIKKNIEKEKQQKLEAEKKAKMMSQQIYSDYKNRNQVYNSLTKRTNYGFNKKTDYVNNIEGVTINADGKKTMIAPKFSRNYNTNNRSASPTFKYGTNNTFNNSNSWQNKNSSNNSEYNTFTPRPSSTYKVSKPPFAKSLNNNNSNKVGIRNSNPTRKPPLMNIYNNGLAKQMLNNAVNYQKNNNTSNYMKKKITDNNKEKRNNKNFTDNKREDSFNWRKHIDNEESLTGKYKGKKLKGKKNVSSVKKITSVTLDNQVSMVGLSKLVSIPIDTLVYNAKTLGVHITNTHHDILDNTLVKLILEMNNVQCSFYGAKDEFKDYMKVNPDSYDKKREPVICVLGHVDHGKTSLLDCIKKSKVVEMEAGGITQNISLYQLKEYGNKIIIDTPGHSVFSIMRKTGVHLTDIVILIIAADDGIQDQTREIIEVLKHYNKKIIICITKIDKVDNFNPAKIYNELSTKYGIVPEEYGGEVPVVQVSNKTGAGIDKLLETIDLFQNDLDLGFNSKREAIGTVVNSNIEKGFGVVTYILLKQGTLKIGDEFVSGKTFGKVRFIFTPKAVKSCTPNDIIKIVGTEEIANSGDDFVVINNEILRKEVIAYRKETINMDKTYQSQSEESIFSNLEKKRISILLKADTSASLYALEEALKNLSNNQMLITIFSANIGMVTDHDLEKAKEFQLTIVAFNVKIPKTTSDAITIISSDVIYDILDEVVNITKEKKKVKKEELVGNGEVIEIFTFDKTVIAGSKITFGSIFHSDEYICEIFRNSKSIYKGLVRSMQRNSNKTKEAKNGTEVGIIFDHFNDIQLKDQIKCYKIVEEIVILN